jgi:hypothetical protein
MITQWRAILHPSRAFSPDENKSSNHLSLRRLGMSFRSRAGKLTSIATVTAFAALAALPMSAPATQTQAEPIELLIDFQIAGNFSGTDGQTITYTIGGPGYAPWWILSSGEIIDQVLPFRQAAVLSNAQVVFPAFDFNNPPGVVTFTCNPGSCSLATGGSVLQSDAGVPLEGRAPFMWGPVFKSPAFDPVNGVVPMRILGCGGLKETSGHGKYAGMVGSICFNGTLNFSPANPLQLTGASKCTITLHTPVPGTQIP